MKVRTHFEMMLHQVRCNDCCANAVMLTRWVFETKEQSNRYAGPYSMWCTQTMTMWHWSALINTCTISVCITTVELLHTAIESLNHGVIDGVIQCHFQNHVVSKIWRLIRQPVDINVLIIVFRMTNYLVGTHLQWFEIRFDFSKAIKCSPSVLS